MRRIRDSIGRLVYAYDTPPGANHARSTIRGEHAQGRTPSTGIPKKEIDRLKHSTTPIDKTVLPMNADENLPVT